MVGSSEIEGSPSWYQRFIERLEPGERLGELLFGLIMVLTFTLGAGIELADREETRTLLVAALGCNVAWGIIDAVLYLIGRLSERGRLHRLVRTLQATPERQRAQALVARELRDRLPEFVSPQLRAALDAEVLERARGMPLERNRLTAHDAWGALAVFWLVFLTALPPVLPFLLIESPQLAMRISNAILIALLCYVGWRWAGYTGASRWGTALCVTVLSVALVVVAVSLGG
jgi:VIT1/CCC1 family predicted Fe2+/Mn2+ transporter